jgi:hypothetical protein
LEEDPDVELFEKLAQIILKLVQDMLDSLQLESQSNELLETRVDFNLDSFSVQQQKLNYILAPFDSFQKKLPLMRSRITTLTILVINNLRSRIGFFFLYNFLDKYENDEFEKESLEKHCKFLQLNVLKQEELIAAMAS